jgi:hypothetical protein
LLENWEHYFETRYEGLGTTYERFVLHDYFRKIKDRHGVKTVLEAPILGMTGISGINSVWWARQDTEVTLVDHSRERLGCIKRVWQELFLNARLVYVPRRYASLPFADGEFDMSWNFAALDPAVDVKSLLFELARVTRKVIFVCVSNQDNLLRPFFNLLQKGQGFSEQSRMNSKSILTAMTREGWQLEEAGYFDVPPWPDIAMTKEELFRKMGLAAYAERLQQRVAQRNRLCILDYYMGMDKAMERRMRRYAFLERSPRWLGSLWAHHRYQIFTPRDRG